jgi:hypothetical protein
MCQCPHLRSREDLFLLRVSGRGKWNRCEEGAKRVGPGCPGQQRTELASGPDPELLSDLLKSSAIAIYELHKH